MAPTSSDPSLAFPSTAGGVPAWTDGTMLMTSIRVRFHELDPYGHVNHGVYLNYFEEARVELLERIGFGLGRLQELGHHIVVVEVRVSFRAPATAGDLLTIESTITDLRRVSSTWHQRMLRGDELIATNDVRAALTDLNGRPTAPPPGLAEALQEHAAGQAGGPLPADRSTSMPRRP